MWHRDNKSFHKFKVVVLISIYSNRTSLKNLWTVIKSIYYISTLQSIQLEQIVLVHYSDNDVIFMVSTLKFDNLIIVLSNLAYVINAYG